MKICKKCRKHVANKTKICKFCGADVSKCKIIKVDNPKSNKNLVNDNVQQKDSSFDEKIELKNNFLDKEIFDEQLNKKTARSEINEKFNIKNFIKINEKYVKKYSFNKKNKNKCKKIKRKVIDKNIIKSKFNLISFKDKFRKFLNYKLFKCISVKFFLIILVLVCCLGLIFFILSDDNSSFDNKKEEDIALNLSKDKLFKMGEVINYKGVKYKVLDVETSFGNSYKEPKKGNQFLIVTISILNDTKDKIEYSYNNWTMSNSESEEESKRIFTSINVDTALYSGKLVVGGVKKGSIVFEQPIDNEDIRLNFYELTKDEEGTTIIDKNKKVFSVKIDVPKEENLDEN